MKPQNSGSTTYGARGGLALSSPGNKRPCSRQPHDAFGSATIYRVKNPRAYRGFSGIVQIPVDEASVGVIQLIASREPRGRIEDVMQQNATAVGLAQP